MKYINYQKIKKIRLTKANFYVAIDFDKTITSSESCDSWDASGEVLGEEYRKKSSLLYKKYEPVESNYNISFEEKSKAIEEWYYKCMQLYYEYKLTKQKLEKSINKSNLVFRKGAKEFLYDMYKNNIPVIILSAGIGNVIEFFLGKNECYYDNIYIISNYIQFDDDGNMKEYKGKLIHTLNKTMEGNLTYELNEKLKNRQYKLLFGDYIEDKKMISEKEWEKTIFVRFFK